MAMRSRRNLRYFDVPVQDLMLRISGTDDLHEEARAAGMQFWEQIQSFAIRQPAFRTSRRPLPVPDTAPPIVKEMAATSARAGVGPMFTFQGALVEFVGRAMARSRAEIGVSCGGDHYIATKRRARLLVYRTPGAPRGGLAVVVKPELGPHGIYTTMGRPHLPADSADAVVVVARSCILADAAAAGASAILVKPGSFRRALSYLQGLEGVYGAMVLRGERIGMAGGLELAA